MSTNTPDVSEISLMELQERPFPLRIDYRIAISNRAYKTICEHAKENIKVELCGVLIGEVFKDAQGPFLEITDAIRGEYATNQGAQVTFTHKTWSYINNVKDSEFPDKRIVGWYHTHPRFGVFLSSQDMFIHENFFNQPWHTAFVIDPISEDEGFFVWQNGNPILIEQYWVAGKKKMVEGDLINSKKMPSENLENIIETILNRNKKGLRPFHLLIISIIFTSLLAAYLIRMNINFDRILTSQKQNSKELIKVMDNLQEDSLVKTNKLYLEIENIRKAVKQHSEHLANKIDNIQKYSFINPNERYVEMKDVKNVIAQNKELANLDIKIRQKGNHIWCYGEVYTWHQKELVAKVVGSVKGVESVDYQDIVVTQKYITSPGDNLSKIAVKVYGNPNKWLHIFEANRQNIKHPDKIDPFIALSLPEPF